MQYGVRLTLLQSSDFCRKKSSVEKFQCPDKKVISDEVQSKTFHTRMKDILNIGNDMHHTDWYQALLFMNMNGTMLYNQEVLEADNSLLMQKGDLKLRLWT